MILDFDIYISQYLFALGRSLPDFFVTFLAVYLIWFLVLAVALYFYRTKPKKWLKYFLAAVVAAAFTKLINFLISVIWFRQRPFNDLNFEPIISLTDTTKVFSFPSDHASISWVLALVIFWQNKKHGSYFILAAFLISIGRILAGVHFLFDILSGILVALLGAYFYFLIIKYSYDNKS